MSDVCYALCLALWECGAGDDELLARCEYFFPLDVEFWKENGEPGLWKKRECALEKFREKLRVPKEKPRKPKTGRVYRPGIHKGDVIGYDSGGIKCGAAVLEVYDRECWRALIAVARKYRKDGQMMTMEEILQSPIRCLCWFDKRMCRRAVIASCWEIFRWIRILTDAQVRSGVKPADFHAATKAAGNTWN